MANEFIARNGVISRGNVVVTGSLTTSGSLTATGTITATTLVVQTVTSSISSITGSTNFGSLSSNTHTFTGSINASGSANFSGSVTAGSNIVIPSGYELVYGTGTVSILGNTTTNNLDFRTNNTQRMFISASGNIGIGTSSPQMPLSVQANTGNGAIRLIGTSNASSNNAGIYWYDSNDSTFNGYLGNFSTSFDIYNQRSTPMAFYIAGTERMRLNSSQGLVMADGMQVLTTGGYYRLRTSASATTGLFIHKATWTGIGTDYSPSIAAETGYGISFFTNGTGTERMRLYYDGYIAMNSVVYGTTTAGTTRTLYIGDANYIIGGISSIRASKKNIADVTNIDWLYQLNPVTFNYRKKDEEGNYTEENYTELNYGLIAEDTQPIADFLINYNDKEDGTKEMIGIEYPRLITPMLKAIQEQNALITNLRTEIEELKARI